MHSTATHAFIAFSLVLALSLATVANALPRTVVCQLGSEFLLDSNNDATVVCASKCPVAEAHQLDKDGNENALCIPVCGNGFEHLHYANKAQRPKCAETCETGYNHPLNANNWEVPGCLPVCGQNQMHDRTEGGREIEACIPIPMDSAQCLQWYAVVKRPCPVAISLMFEYRNYAIVEKEKARGFGECRKLVQNLSK
jgi:hypothetical protein